ncbi:MAG TPA: hypothetical protein VMU00_06145 [Steroidobacteraceae bacterium]|nr:hypothetical protein [Steroidobacteraceae bacterium]
MRERDEEHFELDEEFLADAEADEPDYDRLIDRVDRKKVQPSKKGKAAWSKLEDVLAERRLKKALEDFEDEA